MSAEHWRGRVCVGPCHDFLEEDMTFLRWLRAVKPADVLKWGGVVFAYVLGILFVISVILSMVGVFE